MQTALVLVCLISTLDLGLCRVLLPREPVERDTNFGIKNWETTENSSTSARLPRKFSNDKTHITRLNIVNQTGFDGKVQRIHVNSDEDTPGDTPGVRAYGFPNKNFEVGGLIERVPVQRNGRLVEAYGMPKDRLEDNGFLERVVPPTVSQTPSASSINKPNRPSRSIDAEPKNETDEEDLEAQDAKVFRPLFAYRQQQIKKQRLNQARNRVYGHYHSGSYKPCNDHSHIQ